jgi:chloride channel 3/4/5
MVQAFFTATISTLVLKKVDPTHTGRLVQFAVSYRHQWHWFELFAFAALGVMGGVVGSCINFLNGYWCRLKRKSRVLRRHQLLEIGVLAFVTAILNYRVPFLREGMLEVLSGLFEDCVDQNHRLCVSDEGKVIFDVFTAGCVRMLLMTVTFGAKLPAGCFVPALFIGACLGRAVGVWMKAVVHLNADWTGFASCGADPSHCVIPGVYAIVGAAAVLAGVTRMTICLVVIMFELTGGLEYVVPCMLVTITSKWVAEVLGCPSIYEIHLALTGYPYLDAKEEFDDDSVTVAHMQSALGTLGAPIVSLWSGQTLAHLKEIVRGHMYKWFPIVVSQGNSTLIGFVSRSALCAQLRAAEQTTVPTASVVFFAAMAAGVGYANKQRSPDGSDDGVLQVLDWSKLVDSCTVVVHQETPVRRVLHIFKSLGIQQIAVSNGSAKLVGLCTRKDLTQFLRTKKDLGRGTKSSLSFNIRGLFLKWMRGKEAQRKCNTHETRGQQTHGSEMMQPTGAIV